MNETQGSQTSSPSGARSRLLKQVGSVLLLCLAGYAVLFVLHFKRTPTFAEWAESTPVEDRVWQARTAVGGVPFADFDYLGPIDPRTEGDASYWAEFEFEVDHGDEALLRLTLKAHSVFDELTLARRGLDFEVAELDHDPRFSVVAVVSVQAPPEEQWEDPPRAVRIAVDSFLLAGPGEPRITIRHGESVQLHELPAFEPVEIGRLAGSLIAKPFGGPPSEGVWYHSRQQISLGGRLQSGAGSGAAISPAKLDTSDSEYSVRLFAQTSDMSAAGGHFRSTQQFNRNLSWGDRTW